MVPFLGNHDQGGVVTFHAYPIYQSKSSHLNAHASQSHHEGHATNQLSLITFHHMQALHIIKPACNYSTFHFPSYASVGDMP